jgi:formate dehydrogenase major subunit
LHFPLLLTTGCILSQYDVGAQTRRTANSLRHKEDLLEIHPHEVEQRGVRDGDWHRSGTAGRGLDHVPSPRHAGERHYRLYSD